MCGRLHLSYLRASGSLTVARCFSHCRAVSIVNHAQQSFTASTHGTSRLYHVQALTFYHLDRVTICCCFCCRVILGSFSSESAPSFTRPYAQSTRPTRRHRHFDIISCWLPASCIPANKSTRFETESVLFSYFAGCPFRSALFISRCAAPRADCGREEYCTRWATMGAKTAS